MSDVDLGIVAIAAIVVFFAFLGIVDELIGRVVGPETLEGIADLVAGIRADEP